MRHSTVKELEARPHRSTGGTVVKETVTRLSPALSRNQEPHAKEGASVKLPIPSVSLSRSHARHEKSKVASDRYDRPIILATRSFLYPKTCSQGLCLSQRVVLTSQATRPNCALGTKRLPLLRLDFPSLLAA